jgi:cobalt-zinc-cadmium efflux system membrane fusion protein
LGLGEVVSETTNAFTLSDLSRVWVTFGVSPKDLNKVLVGKSVTVSAPELNAEVTGTVAYVGSLLGEQTRTATVRVTLENPQGAWRPGLFVTVQVDTDTRQTKVAVPEAAIQTVEDKQTVFVRTDDGFKSSASGDRWPFGGSGRDQGRPGARCSSRRCRQFHSEIRTG